MKVWKSSSPASKTRTVNIFVVDVMLTDCDGSVNCTTFYMLVFNKVWDLPSVIPGNVHRKALIRLSTRLSPDGGLPEQDITTHLKTLDLPAARISRRPSPESIPFCYTYFVEAFDRNDFGIPSWRATVEQAVDRVRAKDTPITLIGIW